jgi:hypothetical protein
VRHRGVVDEGIGDHGETVGLGFGGGMGVGGGLVGGYVSNAKGDEESPCRGSADPRLKLE